MAKAVKSGIHVYRCPKLLVRNMLCVNLDIHFITNPLANYLDRKSMSV